MTVDVSQLPLAAEAGLVGVACLAFTLEAVLGFGSTVFVVTMGGLFLPLSVVLPAFVPVNVLLSAWLVLKSPGLVDRRVLFGRIAPPMGLGLVLGLCVPVSVDRGVLLGVFGLLVVALALPEILALARPRAQVPSRRPLSRLAAAGVLGLGGVIHGLFGSGGPMVVYFAGREGLEKSAFRATLSALWLLLNGVLIAAFVQRGELGADSLLRSAAMLPAVAIGAVLGERIHRRVDVRLFRSLVFTLLGLAGLALAIRNLLP